MKKFAVVSAVLMLVAALPAAAQLGMRNSRGHVAPARLPGDGHSEREKARAVMNNFAECLDRADHKRVIRLLALPPFSSKARQEMKNVSDQGCMVVRELRFDPSLLRGSLFVVLFNRAAATSEGAVTVAPIDYSADTVGETSPRAAQYVTMRQFAACVVKKDPANSRAVVASAAGSDSERLAYSNLSPALSDCIIGDKVKFSKQVVSGLLAEVLYRSTIADIVSNRARETQ
ncbi:hypothetical protein G4G27_10065 [Sphingomonas sp. So64.6b]|uniref:hypothetical protein n=1 Tax=Sphingomonas sp. So64.6b TaxID=2997354 RepID=UPI0016022DE7|nr:hypothetical protein [Sphingomonas sp. So64.6b]QNA84294.1 hypothetical protein G4G27_10065 [Sphingomonas sp. So64.6b]